MGVGGRAFPGRPNGLVREAMWFPTRHVQLNGCQLGLGLDQKEGKGDRSRTARAHSTVHVSHSSTVRIQKTCLLNHADPSAPDRRFSTGRKSMEGKGKTSSRKRNTPQSLEVTQATEEEGGQWQKELKRK
jgi:hypothetical protein